ncbi:hypothetical protein [Collimonas fungivorans]|uniref:hypothetical protein n=1 Tax=Collimonas fungivorans TaxID=158899 RepID=UPI003FA3A5BC
MQQIGEIVRPVFGSLAFSLAAHSVQALSRLSLHPETPVVYVAGKDFEFMDAEDNWRTLTSLPDDGAVTVRPDGFVLSRSDDMPD